MRILSRRPTPRGRGSGLPGLWRVGRTDPRCLPSMSDKIDYVNRRTAVAAVLLVALWAGSAAAGDACPACAADANGDGQIAVSELIGAVGQALDGCPEAPQSCHGDADCDGRVSIAEIVRAVRFALSGCGGSVAGRVVDAAWLLRELDNPLVQVIDARVGGFPGGHIPGAIALSPYELATTVDGVAAQIVDLETAAAILSSGGLRRPTIAVVYGSPPEFDAARVVWALTYLGHRDVRYLDGGLASWLAAGGPVELGEPYPAEPTDYVIDGFAPGIRADGAWILDRLGEPPYEDVPIQIVDARSPAEYADGHIPTATHRPWPINLEGGRLRPRAELEALYANFDKSRPTIVYCLAGWRASLTWLVLVQLGFEDVRVYDGSWLEWGDAARGFPVEVPVGFVDGLFAACRLHDKEGPAGGDSLHARLMVVNYSGRALAALAPGEIAFSGGRLDLVTVPEKVVSVPDLDAAMLEWTFKVTGATRVTAAANATTADGATIAIGPLSCGAVVD